MGDDLGGEPVATIERITGNLRHASLIAEIRHISVNFTVPFVCMPIGKLAFFNQKLCTRLGGETLPCRNFVAGCAASSFITSS